MADIVVPLVINQDHGLNHALITIWSGTGGENVVITMQKTMVQCNYIWIPLRPDL